MTNRTEQRTTDEVSLASIMDKLADIEARMQQLDPGGKIISRYKQKAGEGESAVDTDTFLEVSSEQPLENCTEMEQVPLSEEGDETMATRQRLRVCVGYNDDGSPVIKHVTAKTEMELADRVAKALLDSERRGEFVKANEAPQAKEAPQKPALPMFKEYAEEWFRVYKEGRVKPTTAGNYRTILEWHLYPAWGEVRLDEITTKGIQEFLNTKKDKSHKTIQEILTMLKAVLESAKQDRLIDFNPADDHRLVIPSKRKKVREALPMEAVQDIIANLGKLETMDQRYMALAIFTGMRRGEIIGLRWGDIDLENNILHVQRNVTFPKGTNDPYIGTTKTESGVRDIPIMPMLLDYLKPGGEPDAYVVGDEKKPITFSIHRRMMERIRRTIDLHGACSHVFRHSFATMLNDAGASVKTIQSIIGQKDFKTTADRYCHPRDNRKQEAVEGVDKLLCS